ncbi:MAG: hypothetical protein KA764_17490, partial [Anaerolineales bacterium]|nr:hypothetical protein [Anaerolineales bacterium]
MSKRVMQILGALMILSIIITACGPAATPTPAPQATQAPAATTAPSTGSGTFLERALAGEFKGTIVTATGPFTDEDAVKFDATMKAFEDQTGI